MKYYYEPNDKWYDTKQELVDAYNKDFEGTHSTKVTIDNWTEEQWNTIWKPSMKKLEIKTEKATLLVVDDSNWDGCIHEFVGVNYNGYKHLGKVSEITEEDWRGVVETSSRDNINIFKIYNTVMYGYSATESGLSFLKANGVILENKYQDDWDELCTWGHGDFSKDGKSSFELYTEEQQKVWSNPHVFIKIERGN